MLWTIERNAVLKNQSNVIDEFIGIEVARVIRIRVWLRRIRGGKLAINCRKVHRAFYDSGIVRDIKCDGINRMKEWTSIFHLAQCSDC